MIVMGYSINNQSYNLLEMFEMAGNWGFREFLPYKADLSRSKVRSFFSQLVTRSDLSVKGLVNHKDVRKIIPYLYILIREAFKMAKKGQKKNNLHLFGSIFLTYIHGKFAFWWHIFHVSSSTFIQYWQIVTTSCASTQSLSNFWHFWFVFQCDHVFMLHGIIYNLN